MRLQLGSLFAGVGGLELGFERAARFHGFDVSTVWQVESDPFARRILEKHWPTTRRFVDVVDFPPAGECDLSVDVVLGGPPCQPVSIAGQHKGEEDDRWLWPEMARICKILEPRFVVVENVLGLLSAGAIRGGIFGNILRDLAEIGFGRIRWDCLSSADVGAPTKRDRVFIVAQRSTGDLSDLEGGGMEGNGAARQQVASLPSGEGIPRRVCSRAGRGHWKAEPRVPRMVARVPAGVDPSWRHRVRCLGNSVCPQVAEAAAHLMFEMWKGNHED